MSTPHLVSSLPRSPRPLRVDVIHGMHAAWLLWDTPRRIPLLWMWMPLYRTHRRGYRRVHWCNITDSQKRINLEGHSLHISLRLWSVQPCWTVPGTEERQGEGKAGMGGRPAVREDGFLVGIFIFHKNKTETGREVVRMEKRRSPPNHIPFYGSVSKTAHTDQNTRKSGRFSENFSWVPSSQHHCYVFLQQ